MWHIHPLSLAIAKLNYTGCLLILSNFKQSGPRSYYFGAFLTSFKRCC